MTICQYIWSRKRKGEKSIRKEIWGRSYRNYDSSRFTALLDTVDWSEFDDEETPDRLCEIMLSNITKALDAICPIMKLMIPSKNRNGSTMTSYNLWGTEIAIMLIAFGAMCVCVFVCICIYLNTHMCVYMYICKYIYEDRCMYIVYLLLLYKHRIEIIFMKTLNYHNL